jgi:hypothetical protein
MQHCGVHRPPRLKNKVGGDRHMNTFRILNPGLMADVVHTVKNSIKKYKVKKNICVGIEA